MSATATKPCEIGLLLTPGELRLARAGLKWQKRWGMKVPDAPSGRSLQTVDGRFVGELCEIVPSLLGGGLWDARFWLDNSIAIRCPYGNPQAEPVRYYLKEPVQVLSINDGVPSAPLPWVELLYLGDGPDATEQAVEITPADYHKLLARRDWREPSSPMFMLKSFARTWLTGARTWPERLGDMSDEDATAEGARYIEKGDAAGFWEIAGTDACDETPRAAYEHLWDSINGKGSWQADKWVWCVEWEVLGDG